LKVITVFNYAAYKVLEG